MAERQKPMLIRAMQLQADGTMIPKTVRADEIKQSDYRHASLPPELKARAELLWDRIGKQAFREMTLAEWIDGFRKDTNPDKEMDGWMGPRGRLF